MIFVKNSRGGREVNMINTLSKIGGEGGGSTSIWIMSLNILFLFLEIIPKPCYPAPPGISCSQLTSIYSKQRNKQNGRLTLNAFLATQCYS